MSDVTCTGYQITYPRLNLELKKKYEKAYDFTLIKIGLEEINKGFMIKKINKPTKKGTAITFKAITDKSVGDNYMETLNQRLRDFNIKYNCNLKFETE